MTLITPNGATSGHQDARVRFTNAPVLISVRYRVPWRTGMMCLILSKFARDRARLDHLHLLSWALETDGTRELFKTWLSGARSMDRATVRIDPELKVTVTLARGLSLVDIAASKKVALTDLGKAFVAEINGHEGLLATEKAYLRSLGSLNEARLVRTLGAQVK